MSQKIDQLDLLQDYLTGILSRANHHAHNVSSITLSLLSLVIRYKDKGTDIYVRDQKGDLKNMLWFTKNGQKYALSYSHSTGMIDLKQGGMKGNNIFSFDDNTPIQIAEQKFKNL